MAQQSDRHLDGKLRQGRDGADCQKHFSLSWQSGPLRKSPPLSCWQSFAKLKFAALLTRHTALEEYAPLYFVMQSPLEEQSAIRLRICAGIEKPGYKTSCRNYRTISHWRIIMGLLMILQGHIL